MMNAMFHLDAWSTSGALWQMKAAALLGIVLGSSWLPRNAPTSWRRRILAWGLALAVVLPVAADLGSKTTDVAISLPALDMPTLMVSSATRSEGVAEPPVEAATAVSGGGQPSWSVWFVGLWCVGVVVGLLALVRSLVGSLMLGRGARRPSTRLDELHQGLCRRTGVTASLRVHPRAVVPVVLGMLRPQILLPSDAERWPDERLEAVLMHELGHVGQRDHLWYPALFVARTLLWIDPLAWVVLRNFHHASEFAADDAVLRGGIRASSYAAELLALARTSLQHTRLPSAPALGHPELGRRIRRLLESRASLIRWRRVVPWLLGAAGASLTVVLVRPEVSLDPSPSFDEPPAQGDLELPRASSRLPNTTVPDGARIVLDTEAMSFALGGRDAIVRVPLVDRAFAPEDLSGHVVVDLFEALETHASDGSPLAVWVDADVPYSTLVDVLYTSGRRSITDWRIVVRTEDGRRALPIGPPTFDAAPVTQPKADVRLRWLEGSQRELSVDGPVEGPEPGLIVGAPVARWVVEGEDVGRSELLSEICRDYGRVDFILRPRSDVRFGEVIDVLDRWYPACGRGLVFEAGP